MACAACILGMGIGIGSIFLYRVLRKWLRKSSEQLSSSENVQHTSDNRSVENDAEAKNLSGTPDV